MATSTQTASTSISQAGVDAFKRAVKYILTEWPSLNFAIENGMGGSDSKEKRAWMCDHIIEVMLRNKDIDLDDYLAQIINQEFDTLIEDGSLEYNTRWIEKFHKDCLQGREQEVSNSIDQAAAKKISLGNTKIPTPVNTTQESSDDSDDDEGDVM